MIDSFLAGEDWDEAPADMGLEEPYGELLAEVEGLVAGLRAGPAERGAASWAAEASAAAGMARSLLFRAPAIVNVALNYKICAEHGLPFHPTLYYELAEARSYNFPHPIDEIEAANRLYRDSIGLARAAVALAEDFPARLEAFRSALPAGLGGFVYTSQSDKYTWRGSEPEKLKRLALLVREKMSPELIVAAAHGSIMPALILAEYLGLPLYFVRFSMFKRHDEAPILSLADLAWLSAWEKSAVLLFDEDVAGGRTLGLFAEKLSPLFREARTACVIRHAGAAFRPDFTAKVWYD